MQVDTGPMWRGFFTFVGHAQVGLHPSKNLVVLASPSEDSGGVNGGTDGVGAAGDGAGVEGEDEMPGLHCQ